MLNENVEQMQIRLEGVANPDVTIFNVAFPEKPRLSIFQLLAPLETPPTTCPPSLYPQQVAGQIYARAPMPYHRQSMQYEAYDPYFEEYISHQK